MSTVLPPPRNRYYKAPGRGTRAELHYNEFRTFGVNSGLWCFADCEKPEKRVYLQADDFANLVKMALDDGVLVIPGYSRDKINGENT